MSFLKSVTKAVKQVNDFYKGGVHLASDLTGGLIPTNAKEAMGNTSTLASLGLINTGYGTLGQGSQGSQNSSLLSTIFGSGNSDLGSILGSVVKGAVGIGADYFSNQQYYKDQRRLNEQTFEQDKWLARQKYKYDTQAADTAYQRDVAMWNMQNNYNAPSAQMERLQQAGLNPNLVYGGGSVTGNTAGSPPSYTPASYPQVSAPSSKAQKLDLMRNVLGIFDQYQSIKNQALDNQREYARIALQSRALDLQEEREKNKEKNDERRFQVLLANLGFRQNDTAIRQEEVHNQNAWRRYQDDVKQYESVLKGLSVKDRQRYKARYRQPMYMDYL